jgi:hypothetical protein
MANEASGGSRKRGSIAAGMRFRVDMVEFAPGLLEVFLIGF